ncbi:AbrB family transcriptional regulator [Ancylobacter terrae]|uniref:AbrB family transcriptional regulator n=1 Tax=Ancylobacter sp. sgz301288 TaxID=3342077 RepID=UPI00385D747D
MLSRLFSFDLKTLRRVVVTLLIGAAGGGIFALLGVPAGWLSGALTTTGIAALAGVSVGLTRPVREVTYVVLGTSLGAAVSPATLNSLSTWPVTMTVLALSVPVMMAAVIFYLEKAAGWDRRSAFFAASPGALSAVLAMAESTGADTRRVVFAQSIRLFVLVALLPPAFSGFGHQPSGVLPVNPVVPDWMSLVASLAAGTFGALAAERARLPGGSMVGAMLASGVVHGAGLIEGRMPDLLLVCGFTVLGSNIGSRFAGTRIDVLRRFVVHSLGALAIAAAVSVLFALIGAWLSGEALAKVVLAYMPGALEAMTIMAFVLGVDPAFVAAHHLLRFVGLSLVVPVIASFAFSAVPEEKEAPPPELDSTEPKD